VIADATGEARAAVCTPAPLLGELEAEALAVGDADDEGEGDVLLGVGDGDVLHCPPN
jgi:hypothetical protein